MKEKVESAKTLDECLLCLRIPLEDIVETTKCLYDREMLAKIVAERAGNLLRSAYLKSPPELCGKSPKGLMAAAIYTAGLIEDLHKSQGEIAKIIGITEVTLRIRYFHLMKVLEIDLKGGRILQKDQYPERF